jgi:hypothetical protein
MHMFLLIFHRDFLKSYVSYHLSSTAWQNKRWEYAVSRMCKYIQAVCVELPVLSTLNAGINYHEHFGIHITNPYSI